MNVPPAALATYETLRGEVIAGQGRPAGLTAIIHHGMLRGLGLLLAEAPPISAPRVSSPASMPLDRELLRCIANLVLQAQSQVTHVY